MCFCIDYNQYNMIMIINFFFFFTGAPGDNNVWLTSSSDSHSLLGGDINSSLSLDLSSGENRMVCPNSVMPVTVIQIPYDTAESSGTYF